MIPLKWLTEISALNFFEEMAEVGGSMFHSRCKNEKEKKEWKNILLLGSPSRGVRAGEDGNSHPKHYQRWILKPVLYEVSKLSRHILWKEPLLTFLLVVLGCAPLIWFDRPRKRLSSFLVNILGFPIISVQWLKAKGQLPHENEKEITFSVLLLRQLSSKSCLFTIARIHQDIMGSNFCL